MKGKLFFMLSCLAVFVFPAAVQAQDMFYFLVDGSLQVYNFAGDFQESFPLPSTGEKGYLSGMTTDGTTAWYPMSHTDGEYELIRQPLRGGDNALRTPINMIPHYFMRGIAKTGDTLFIGRNRHYNYVTELYKIERYSALTGGLLGHCFCPRSPGDMQWVDGKLASGSSDYISIYVNGCDLQTEFATNIMPGVGINALCANSHFIWVFKSSGDYYSTGIAFEWNGTRRDDKDILFEGLTTPYGACIAWGPDAMNIRLAQTSLNFEDVAEGASKSLPVTVRNVGNLDLDISSMTLSDTVNYSLQGQTSALLPPGTQIQVTVEFHPQSVGVFDAVLIMNSDDPDQPEAMCSLTGQGRASVIYVDGSRATSGDGQSWEQAFNSISTALASAEVVDNSEIWITGHTFNVSSEIVVDKAVSLYGGFAGGETSRAQRDVEANPTVIDAGQACRCMTVTAAGTVTIDGITFRNGMIAYPDYYGAGLWLNNNALDASVSNCSFDSCSTSYQGGGIHSTTISSALIDNCTITNCQASEGAGVYCGANTVLTSCTINDNAGQGVYAIGDARLSKCTVLQNTNGGIYTNGPVLITDSLIAGNTGPYRGPGIYTSWDSHCQIINCTIIDNSIWLETTCKLINSILWEIGAEYLDVINYGTITYSAILNPSYGTSTGQDSNGNTRQYPMFIDPDGPDNDPTTYLDNNYAIASGSPCADAADGEQASADDILGNGRYDDVTKTDTGTGTPSYADIGAYEQQLPIPNILYVDPDAEGDGTGRTWANALTDIQTAIDTVPTGKSIYIKGGTYVSLPVEVKRDCQIYGGFAGHENAINERDIESNPTILDGQGTNKGISFNKLTVMIDGITCRNCLNGIYALMQSDLTLKNTAVIGCTFNNIPSGLFIDGNLTVSDCVFSGNKGGAIQVSSGSVRMDHTIVAGNYGDGIKVLSPIADSVVESCTVVDNSGYGIIKSMGVVDTDIRNCIINNNASGAVNIYQGTYRVEYCNLDGGDFGVKNIHVDPLFAQPGSWDDNGTSGDNTDDIYTPGDYHLQSEFGRWDPVSKGWVNDPQSSLCIDAGDPESLWENEPWPSRRRINIGCYGGSREASLSDEVGPDLTLDGWIDVKDIEIIVFSWLQADQTCDLYPPGGDGIIDLNDFATIAMNYLPEPEPVLLDFENNAFDPQYTWETGGTPGWSVIAVNTSEDNQYQATSAISAVPAYSNSYLNLTIDAGELDTLTFTYTVSPNSYRIDCAFFIDGNKIADLTSQSWTQLQFDVAPGEHTYQWKATNTYWGNASEYMRLDDITFTAEPPQ